MNMPHIKVNNAKLYYEKTGNGPEAIVFAHSYLLNSNHFKYQIETFKNKYLCLAYDHRGHGLSEITESGYDMDNLYRDAVCFIDAANCAPCHFAGLSMGGIIGMMIAVRRPDLLKSLILMDTPAELGAGIPLIIKNAILGIPRILGWRLLSGAIMTGMFGKKFRRDPKNRNEIKYWKEVIKSNNVSAAIKTAKGIAALKDLPEVIHKINIPTLIIAGEKDISAGVRQAERIAGLIPGARLAVIPEAGHISSLEEPEAVNNIIKKFLDSMSG